MQSSVLTLTRPGMGNAPQLLLATVRGRAENWFFVDGIENCERCLRAESCLLEPEVGDTVLLCVGGAGGASYILSILTRMNSSGSTLSLPGGSASVTEEGNMRLAARSVELSGAEQLALSAPRLEVSAASADMRFHRLSSLMETLDAKVGVLNLVAKTFNLTVGRLLQKARDSFRWTENLDETRAGRMRQKVEGRYHLESAHAAILAEGLVKIDGEKIDLG